MNVWWMIVIISSVSTICGVVSFAIKSRSRFDRESLEKQLHELQLKIEGVDDLAQRVEVLEKIVTDTPDRLKQKIASL